MLQLPQKASTGGTHPEEEQEGCRQEAPNWGKVKMKAAEAFPPLKVEHECGRSRLTSVYCVINTLHIRGCRRLALISRLFKEESNLELQ